MIAYGSKAGFAQAELSTAQIERGASSRTRDPGSGVGNACKPSDPRRNPQDHAGIECLWEARCSSRFYGLTTGGINATEFALTTVGKDATGENAERRVAALKAAVLNVPPYKAFFEHFVDKKVPGDPAFAEFLRKYASVPSDRVEECMEHIVADAETAGLLRSMSGGKWVDMTGIPAATSEEQGDQPDDGDDGETGAVERATSTEGEGIPAPVASESETPATSKRPNAIFVGHGRNKKPRDQLVKILTEYGIPHKVAEDEPNRGRPIPTKVKETMSR